MRYHLLLISLFFSTISFGEEGAYTKAQLDVKQIAIIQPGDYKSREIPRTFGDGWLALVKNGNRGWNLVPAKVKNKPCLDCELSERLVTSDKQNAIFLLRHTSLSAGPIQASRLNLGNSIMIETQVEIGFGGETYRIALEKPKSRKRKIAGDSYVERYREVVLHKGSERTVIGKRPPKEDNEGWHDLLWAGDLDHDGKLDFIIYDGFNNGSLTCLYLSSVADEKQIVKRISCFSSSGC